MKKFLRASLIFTLTLFMLPTMVNAAGTDEETLEVTTDQTISEDSTYGALRISNNATLTIEKGVTLTIDGNKGITLENSDKATSLALVTDGKITINEGATLNIINSKSGAYAAFRTTGASVVTINGGTLNVSDNDTRGMDNTMGLTMTINDGKLYVNNNSLNAMNGTTGGITATDSYIEGNNNGLGGLNSKFILKGATIINATGNGYSGLTLNEGSIIGGSTVVNITDNNTENNKDKADLLLQGAVTIEEQGGLIATTMAPLKSTWGDYSVTKNTAITINGEEAIAMIGLTVPVCDGQEACTEENIVASDINLTNGVYITMNEELDSLVATIGGNIGEGLELPKEVSKVIINDTVTKDITINVEAGTIIENNSQAKVNAIADGQTTTVNAGEEVTIAKVTEGTVQTPTQEEEKNPETSDMNIYTVIAMILMATIGTIFASKKIYAKVNVNR